VVIGMRGKYVVADVADGGVQLLSGPRNQVCGRAAGPPGRGLQGEAGADQPGHDPVQQVQFLVFMWPGGPGEPGQLLGPPGRGGLADHRQGERPGRAGHRAEADLDRDHRPVLALAR
jgi:hypothetical protein